MKEITDYLVSSMQLSIFVLDAPHNKWPWNLKDVMSLFGAEFAVTGKLWPKLYEIKLRPVDGPADGSVEKLCPKASFYR